MEHRKLGGILLIGLLFMLPFSCKEDKSTSTGGDFDAPTVAEVPSFEADSAYRYIQWQVDQGPRVPGTEAHDKTAQYLLDQLENWGGKVQTQKFSAQRYDGTPLQGKNIIAAFHPQHKDRILLCAHWDSRFMAEMEDESQAVPGANDGASGVGIILEIARLLSEKDPGIGVDIVFFDLEDQGISKGQNAESWALGAQHWSHNPHRPAYQFRMGILLDMVGAKNATFYKEGFSRRYAGKWVDHIWTLASDMGYGNYFVNQQGGGVTDDHYFINTVAGIPTLDIIHKERGAETGFFPHWHTTKDDMKAIDKGTLKAVGRVVTKTIYTLSPEL